MITTSDSDELDPIDAFRAAAVRPLLCCAYTSVYISGLGARFANQPDDSQSLAWGFGLTRYGEHEVLGVWPMLATSLEPAAQLVLDLKARGVETVDAIFDGCGGALSPAWRAAFAQAVGTTSFHQAGATERSTPRRDLSRRSRLAVLRADGLVAHLQDGASAALRRYGCFATVDECGLFAESWLVEAERRLAGRIEPWRRIAPPTSARHRVRT